MRTTLMCRWREKNNKPFIALLAAGAALAMATLVDASSSTQVEQLGPLAVPRTGHAATVLADGRVLITGGRDSAGTFVAVAEIFDPATETSTAVGALVTARVSHTATLLPNGRVLIAGGTSATGSLSSAEIFDPSSPTAGFRMLSATMGAARARHTATLLTDGTVLIAGGDVAGTAEIFDPTTETFSSTLLTMAAPRIGHTATLFANDSVLLAGGNTDSMDLFTPTDQKFTLDSQLMSAVHTGQQAISLSDTRLLFFGGDVLNTIEEFNPSADILKIDATMEAPSSSATLLANGNILVVRADMAGLYAPNAADLSSAFTAFDETSVPGSSMLLRTGQTAMELSGDKKIFVAGGTNGQNLFVDSALFNPARIWTDKDDYQPSEPVVLSGSGWKANEDVYLYAVDTETEAWTYGSTVAADANGEFVVNPYFIVQLAQLGVNFSVTAVGAQSAMQADVKFTDAAKPTSAITFPADGSSYNSAGWTASAASKITGTASFASGSTGRRVDVSIKQNSTNKYWNGSSFNAASETFITATGTTSWSLSFPSSNFPTDGTYVGHSLATDSNGQENGAGGVATFTLDNAAPAAPSAPVLASGSDSGTKGDGITNVNTPTFTGTAEPNSTIQLFSDGNLVGSGTTASNGNYSASVTTPLSDATHAITAKATDAAGNQSAPSAPTSVTIDTQKPSVTINQAAGQSDPTSTSPINFTVVFSESVTGFTAGGVVVSGTAGATTAVVTGSGANYNVAVSGMTTSGTVIATILQNAARDTAANGNMASTSTDNTVTFNSQAATSLSGSPASGPYAGTVNLSATLTSGGSGVNNKTIAFTLNGNSVGSVTTNASGVATLNNVSLSGINAGTYATGVGASFAGDSGYAAANGTASLIVGKANPTATLDVTNSPVAYNGSGQAATVGIVSSSVPGTVANILTGGAATQTNAGTYAVTADFVPNDTTNYNTLTGLSAGNFVIGKVTPTATLAVTNSPQTYNGSGQAATVSISASSVPGTVANILTGGAATQTNAGTYAVTADFVPNDTTNYKSLTGLSAGDFVINKATPTATLAVTNSPQTYNGSGQAALVGITASSVPGAVANILTGGAATQTNAATYAVTVAFVPTDATNYKTLTGLSAGNFVIRKANATVVVTPYTSGSTTYDGHSHTATVASITGVNGETGVTVGTVDVSNTAHTDAGTYASDYWFFTGTANYNNIGNTTITDSIGKANATVVVTPYTSLTTTYDGHSHTATVTSITGVNSETGVTVGTVDVSNTAHTDAGTYASDYWFFTGTANYNNIGNTTITDSIGKANATVVVTPYTSLTTTYDGNPHTATVTSITGVNSETGVTVGTVDVSHTSHTDAGTYASDYWFFTGTANYNDIGNTTITDSIGKATATVVVTPYTSLTTTYDGNPHTATITLITGVNSETGATVGTVDVSNTAHTDAGTYASDYWFFTGTANYNNVGNTTITDSIGKATATVVVTPYTSLTTTYDGNPHTATVTSITGVNSETGVTVGTVDVSHTTHTNAGTYASDYWFFTGTANYNDIGNTTITDSIGKADAGIVIHDYSGTYDANSHGVTATITGVDAGGTAAGTSFSSDMLTNVPGGTVKWSLDGGTNYKDASGTGNVTIGKATAVIHVTAYTTATTTYDASSHTATGTATGVDIGGAAAGTSLNLGGTTHTNAGTYNNDPWSFSGGTNYYDASGTVNDSIAKATAMITVNKYNVTYNGLPHTATATAIGVDAGGAALGSSFNLSGTTHTNAASYTGDTWSFSGGTNYNDASGTVDDSIVPAPLTIKADDKTILLHATLPTFTVTPTGLVNGETMAVLSGTLTFTPTTTPANAGTYDIVPSGLMSNNYVITFQKGMLTVKYSTSCIIFGDPTGVILQPINADGSSVCKAGSTVPAKFRVGDANCNSIGTPGVVKSFYLLQQTSDPNVSVNEDVVSTTPDTAFRWDPTAQQWIFNISTKGMKAGLKYTYQITLNDYSIITFTFALK